MLGKGDLEDWLYVLDGQPAPSAYFRWVQSALGCILTARIARDRETYGAHWDRALGANDYH